MSYFSFLFHGEFESIVWFCMKTKRIEFGKKKKLHFLMIDGSLVVWFFLCCIGHFVQSGYWNFSLLRIKQKFTYIRCAVQKCCIYLLWKITTSKKQNQILKKRRSIAFWLLKLNEHNLSMKKQYFYLFIQCFIIQIFQTNPHAHKQALRFLWCQIFTLSFCWLKTRERISVCTWMWVCK